MGHQEMAESDGSGRSPRVERRRREARAKILAAAEGLLRGDSVEEVTIAQITAAADVGHGTFYLHFESKHDVMVAIAREHAAKLTARLDLLTAGIADPAEVVAVAVRYVLRAIKEDRLWSWFILGSGMPMQPSPFVPAGVAEAAEALVERVLGLREPGLDGGQASAPAVAARADEPGPLGEGGEEAGEGGG